MVTPCKKNNHRDKNKNLISIYMKSSYPFTIQKWLVSVIQFLETMQSQ